MADTAATDDPIRHRDLAPGRIGDHTLGRGALRPRGHLADQLFVRAGPLCENVLGSAQRFAALEVFDFAAEHHEQLAQHVGNWHGLARSWCDELGVDPVALGAPAIFVDDPARMRRPLRSQFRIPYKCSHEAPK